MSKSVSGVFQIQWPLVKTLMAKSDRKLTPPSKTIGWREWLTLPDLGVEAVKAKIDTGARTSSLHASHIRKFERDGKTWVRFDVHPLQKNSRICVHAEAEVLEFREIRSSSGHLDRRPVVVTTVTWNGESWPVEMTLSSRDKMGFRMLLGREAIRGRFAVDAGVSWYGGKPAASVRKPLSVDQADADDAVEASNAEQVDSDKADASD